MLFRTAFVERGVSRRKVRIPTSWAGRKSLEVFLKIPKKEFSKMQRVIPYELEYDERWKQATVRIDDQLKLQKLISAFRMSYEYILGK